MDEHTRASTDDSAMSGRDGESEHSTLRGSTGAPGEVAAAIHVDPIQIGRFVVLRRIGEGGMGIVYAAYDNELDRKLAVKLVRAERARGDETRARVRREAQAMARLSHPNVVQVYEVGDHEGQIYVAMEFVTGPTLAAWAAAQAPGPGRWRAILSMYADAGRGLAAAHAAGIVHRDFKPANAIVGEDGRVRVLDFGIARAPGSEAGESGTRERSSIRPPSTPALRVGLLETPLTTTGVMIGTPAYMSPEQFERRSVDARSDQFSFCVALYEALYGERPFRARNTAALLLAVTTGDLAPAPADAEVPAWVRGVLVRGLATDAEQRWPDMSALLDALARDPELRRRRLRNMIGVAALSLSAVLGSAWFARDQHRSALAAEALRVEAEAQEARARALEAEAEAQRDRALLDAQAAATRARDTARVLAARGLAGDPSAAAALLRDVERPADAPGWRTAALQVLAQPLSERALRGHEDRVVYIDLSPDDRWLVSASFDGTARVWPIGEGMRGPATILRHADMVMSAVFSPDGRRVLTTSRDRSAAIWPAPSEPGEAAGEPIWLRGHEGHLWSGQFSPDGERVLTSASDGTARLWSVADPSDPIVFDAGGGIVWAAEFSPDGRQVATADSFGNVRIFAIAAPERPLIELPHPGSVGDVRFSRAGDRLLTAGWDGRARVFALDLEAGSARETAALDHDGDVYRAEFSDDGAWVVTASQDQSAKLWTLDEAGALVGPPQVFDEFAGSVWSAAFAEAQGLLVIGARDRAVQVRPLAGGPPLSLRGHTADVFRVRFSHDGRRLFSGSHDGTVRIWSTDWTHAHRSLPTTAEQLTALERSGDSLFAAGDGGVWVWPLVDEPARVLAARAPTRLAGHQGGVRLALSAAPRVLATGDGGGRVRVWAIDDDGVRSPERPLELELGGAPSAWSSVIGGLAIDPSAELIVAQTMDGAVHLWRLAGLSLAAGPRRLTTHDDKMNSAGQVGFSPDGQAFVSAGADGRARLWTRAELLAEPGPGRAFGSKRGRLMHLQLSPDSTRAALASANRMVELWALDGLDDAPLAVELPAMPLRIGFDPSGRLLAAGCSDTNVYVWDLDRPGAPLQLTGPAGEVRDVLFAPDGRWLAAVSLDATVHVWSLTLDDGAPVFTEPISFTAAEPLHRLVSLGGGERIAASGFGPAIELWTLGDGLDVESLRRRLEQATSICLPVAQRMQLAGESREVAEAGLAACLRDGRG